MLLQSAIVAFMAGFAADGNAALIVGSWTSTQAAKGVTVNVTMEFTKDGRSKIITAPMGRKEFVIEGTYKLDKDELAITGAIKGMPRTITFRIKELTKEKLIMSNNKTNIERTFTRKK